MSQTTEMNTTTPTAGNFRMQMEGLATAILYAAYFVMVHLGANLDVDMTTLLAVFFVGLILVPLLVALPLTLLRGAVTNELSDQANLSAFLPFASLALYALQAIALWVITREAYHWAFAGPLSA